MENLDSKNIENILALTPVQEGMLFHYLKNPGSDYYFEQLSLDIAGEIDLPSFEKAWNTVIATNEMLRTVFRWEKLEKPTQIILKEHPCRLSVYDLSAKNDNQKKTALAKLKDDDQHDTFDLHDVPFRVILCKLTENHYQLIVCNHHILYDGWSNGIILKEFFKAYHQLCRGKETLKLPVKTPFKEFIKWIQSQDRNKQEQFWRNYLAGFETPAGLSITGLSIKRRIEDAVGSGDYSLILPDELRAKLDVFVKTRQVTLAPVFYTAWGILLQKYGNNEDVVFGTTVSGRSAGIKSIEDMVGLFINTIPLRTRITSNEKLSAAVFRTDDVLREREAFEHTPLVDIGRFGSGPLFDTIVAIENYPLDNLVPGGESSLLAIHSYAMAETTHYDLSVGIMPANRIEIKFSFNRELFEKETIANLAEHFKTIIERIVDSPGSVLSELEIISPEEKDHILYDFNNTAAEYPADKTIHQLFVEQAEKMPDHIALVGHVQLTYRQLDKQSNHLAGLLIEKGVLPDSIVGIMMERSLEMVIGILGILKSGGAYLPIDPAFPQERINYMLADSHVKILINKSEIRISKFETNPNDPKINDPNKNFAIPFVLNLDHLNFEFVSNFDIRASNFNSSNIAYIIYTSGSTGKPKGVLIEHAAVVNRLYWVKERYGLTERDVVLQAAPFIFDVSVCELFRWIPAGARLCLLPPGAEMDPGVIVNTIARYCTSTADFVPSVLNLILDQVDKHQSYNQLASLRWLFTGVETVTLSLVKRFRETLFKLNKTKLINAYGPTESTVDVTYFQCTEDYDRVPIGKPMANVRVFILDLYGNLQPVGIGGELCIAGKSLARGYLNNPELTWEKLKIINDKLKIINGSGALRARLYKTGDFGRWLPDGNIEFLGRMDQQVKIRGFRVELGEIESRLLKHPGIKEAVVSVQKEEGGDNYLCAYVVPGSENVLSELREFLAEKLPEYMIPSYFVPLAKIPLTPNGKIDRRALPGPELKAGDSYIAPRDELERKLVAIWSDVLGKDELHAAQLQSAIGINDNFFHLGGHSLKATILAAQIHKLCDVKVPLAEIFKRPRIKDLAKYIKGKNKEFYIAIEPAEEKEYYELSSAQKRLYTLQQMNPAGIAYNIPGVIPLPIPLPGTSAERKIADILKKLIKRHESLRTSFHIIADTPVQKIHKHVEFEIEPIGGPSFIRPFDLSRAPLLRVGLLKNSDGSYNLLTDMHHIIADGISHEIFVTDFNVLWSEDQAFPPLRLQYKDFSEWQNGQREKETLKQQADFWLEEFAEEPPVLDLPTDYPRPLMKSFEGNSVYFEISAEETRALTAEVLTCGGTLFMGLTAILNVLLSKLGGQEEIVIGTPIAGRRYAGLEKIIGMFVNTLALKNYPLGDRTFKEFLADVTERTLMVFENQEYPFEELVDNVSVNRDTGRNPLFDVMLVLQDIEIETGRPVQTVQTVKFDLTLSALEINDVHHGLSLLFQYSTKLFKPGTIERFIIYFKKIVSQVLKNPGIRLREIDIVTEAEKSRILLDFNRTEAVYPNEKAIHQLFAGQVARTPDHIITVGAVHLSYGELNNRSNHIANRLKFKGLKPGAIAGIMVEPIPEMVVGIIGILKAGGVFLPLEPGSPVDRINYVLNDGNARLLLTQAHLAASINARVETINLEDAALYTGESKNVICGTGPADPLYVIYTSGTSGRPKGVLIANNNIVNYVYWFVQTIGLTATDRAILTSSFAFDALYTQFFSSLLTGCQLHVVPRETFLFPGQLLNYLGKKHITYIKVTPSLFNLIANSPGFSVEMLKSLRLVMLGGEEINVKDVEKAHKRCPHLQMMNHYGPTETTIGSIARFLDFAQFEAYKIAPTIGKPLHNTRVYILDKGFNLVPTGVVGDLFIGGDGVGMGYLNKPELTAERFLSVSSVSSVAKIYKTGDLARWHTDGHIEFLGRADHQVKIRGYRIEPGEIENHLLTHNDVKEAVVMVREKKNGEKYLCAYYVSEKKIAETLLREFLSAGLPQPMIPAYFVPLEKMPLTRHNKLNRAELPEPSLAGTGSYTAPGDEVETKLVETWADVLGLEKTVIGIDDNFFQLGGHSLKATILAAKIHHLFNVKVPLAEIFRNPRIRPLAGYIKDAVQWKYEPVEPTEKKEYYLLSSAQKRLYFLQQMDKDGTAYNIPSIMNLEGSIDSVKLEQSILGLIKRHESLRTSFVIIGEEPVQQIHEQVEFKLENYDLDHFIRPFDLSRAPLLRVAVLKDGNNGCKMWIDMHHILSDAVSQELLNRDFMAFYKGEALPPLRLQYKDFAEWENRQILEGRLKKQEEYWQNIFNNKNKIPVFAIPTDYPRPASLDFNGSTFAFEIPGELSAKIKRLVLETETTLYIMLLAVYTVFLAKYTGRHDIIVGSPIAGRTHHDLKNIIGMFVNMIAMRNFPEGTKTFRQFLQEVKKNALNAYENQDYPFDQLVEKIDIGCGTGRHPLVETVFVLDRSGAPTKPYEPGKIAKFDLKLSASETALGIIFDFEYRSQLFQPRTIERMSGHFKRLLENISENPDAPISELDMLTREEMTHLMEKIKDKYNSPEKVQTQPGTGKIEGDFNF